MSLQLGCAEPGASDVAMLPRWSPATHSDTDGQATDAKPSGSTPFVALHAWAPPPGSVAANSPPSLSAATHMPLGAQETASSWRLPSFSTPKAKRGLSRTVVFHAGAAANGFDDVTTFPPAATTHDEVDAQATASGSSAPGSATGSVSRSGAVVAVHADASPVGLFDAKIVPAPKTRHDDAEGHETPPSQPPKSEPGSLSVRSVHGGLAPDGSTVVAISLPFPFVATHSDVVGHEIAPADPASLNGLPSLRHAPASPVGVVETQTSPAPVSATHNDADGHETPVK